MSIRTYSNLILFETLFDNIPNTNQDLNAFVDQVFNPTIELVEKNCGTVIGEMVELNYEVEGKPWLNHDNSGSLLPVTDTSTQETYISRGAIIDRLQHGVYSIHTRTPSTCISKNGVCLKCVRSNKVAFKPENYNADEDVLYSAKLTPAYVINTEIQEMGEVDTTLDLSLNLDEFDWVECWLDGNLIYYGHSTNTLNYCSAHIIGNTLTFDGPIYLPLWDYIYPVVPIGGGLEVGLLNRNVVIRYWAHSRAPFLGWLAGTYSGSMLGLKPLPTPKLPLRKSLLASSIPVSLMDNLINQLDDLKGIPAEAISYIPEIKDPLEKALYVIALFAIYLNVN